MEHDSAPADAGKHSLPPWRVVKDAHGVNVVGLEVEDGPEVQVACCETEGDAHHIVRSVNAHAGLVAALEGLLSTWEEYAGDGNWFGCCGATKDAGHDPGCQAYIARAALAAAKEVER